MMPELNEFHSRDGWYFKRMEDGSVRIRITKEPMVGSPVDRQIILPPGSWASVIASVTPSGETAESYAQAERFHTGTLSA